MINSKNIIADLQFIASKVSKFSLDTKEIDVKPAKANVSFDYDYNIIKIEELNDKYVGLIEFTVQVKAKVKNAVLFKINLIMEGAFAQNRNTLSMEDFKDMLKVNGITMLSQLSRAYIISVSSLSGINPPVKLPMINVYSLIKKKEE